VGKSATIHSTQARFIQRNSIEYPLYRSPRLNAVGVFHSLRVHGVSPIFLKVATTIDSERPLYPATFPSFLHIYHKVPNNPKKTTPLAVFEVGLAFTCVSHFTSATFNVEISNNKIVQSTYLLQNYEKLLIAQLRVFEATYYESKNSTYVWWFFKFNPIINWLL